ncbi:hypothetical protein [Paenibacillus psychroresistens]|uniref:hypothetical protein n=1 Tax=Paenibacillus psychroresistens TaxID=1778678 RepID=UPI001D037B81|nr:hypothetical protein [Paenibacillus psychroresistens]
MQQRNSNNSKAERYSLMAADLTHYFRAFDHNRTLRLSLCVTTQYTPKEGCFYWKEYEMKKSNLR